MSVNCNVCGCYFDGPHAMDTSGEAMHESIVDCLAALRAEVERLTRERDEANGLHEGACQQIAAMRPVVEAACALENIIPSGSGEEIAAAEDWLYRTVCAYRASQPKGGSDA